MHGTSQIRVHVDLSCSGYQADIVKNAMKSTVFSPNKKEGNLNEEESY